MGRVTHGPDFIRTLTKLTMVAIGVALFFAVSAYRVRRTSRKPSPLTRYLMERENKEWLREHNKGRAV